MEKYSAFACKTIGTDHIRRNVCCQDAVAKYNDDTMAIAVVSDGHGSPQYFRSNIGSEIAVQVATECIKSFVENVEFDENNFGITNKITLDDLSDENKRHSLLKGLQKSILIKWHNGVEKHYMENPFEDNILSTLPQKYQDRYGRGDIYGAYGATLIAVVTTKKFWIGLHMGDGHCIAVNKDCSITHPIPWDDNCHDEVTTSLCQNDAIENFRYYYDIDIPYAIYVGSDGVDDSYDDDEMLDALYRGISIVFGKGFDIGVAEVDEYIKVITQKGKGDDTSISGIIDVKGIAECSDTFMMQVQLDKIRTEYEKSEAFHKRIKTLLEYETQQLKELLIKQKEYDSEYLSSKPKYEKISIMLNDVSTKMADIEKNQKATEEIIDSQKMKIVAIKEQLAEAKAKMEQYAAKYQIELVKANSNYTKLIENDSLEKSLNSVFVEKSGETLTEVSKEMSDALKVEFETAKPSTDDEQC